jgi:hypothetical protein
MSLTTPKTKPCEHCGKAFLAKYQWTQREHQPYCSRACYQADYRRPERIEARFWAKVDKSPHPLGCWIWTGARSVSRYGTFNWRGTNINAHRAAWMLTNGPIDKPGIDVLHTCANGIGGCVNPGHLYLGTDKENSRDRVRQGGASKIVTPDQVKRVRQLLAEAPWRRGRNTEIAKIVGVEPVVVCKIRTGKNWKHIA